MIDYAYLLKYIEKQQILLTYSLKFDNLNEVSTGEGITQRNEVGEARG